MQEGELVHCQASQPLQLAANHLASSLLRRFTPGPLPDPHDSRRIGIHKPLNGLDQVILESRPPVFPVGVDVQPHGLLTLEGLQDGLVLDFPQVGLVNPSLVKGFLGLFHLWRS